MARLIDADALLDMLKFLANKKYNRELTTPYSNAYKEVMGFVKCAPTIEPTLQHVESVGKDGSALKRGHWAHGKELSRDYVGDVCSSIHYDGWWCSECGYHFEGKPLWKYCPHCGSRNG